MTEPTPQPPLRAVVLRSPTDKGRFSLAHLLLVVSACAVLAALLASADEQEQDFGFNEEAILVSIGLGFIFGFPLGVLAGRRARNPRSAQALGALFGWVAITSASLLCLRGANGWVALAGLGLLIVQALVTRRLQVGTETAA